MTIDLMTDCRCIAPGDHGPEPGRPIPTHEVLDCLTRDELRAYRAETLAKRDHCDQILAAIDAETALRDRRRFRIGDQVITPGDTGECSGEIVNASLTREQYDRMVAAGRYSGELHGAGPLYVVNEGNVFGHGGAYEAVYAESALAIAPPFDCPPF